MANAPDTAPYILYQDDLTELPNQQTLIGSAAIGLQAGPFAPQLQIVPLQKLASLNGLIDEGILTYNATTDTFSAVTLQSNGSIDILSPHGLSGDPTLSVVDNTTIQKINVEHSSTLIGSRPTLRFIAGSNIALSLSDNSSNDSVDVTIAGTGGGGGGGAPVDAKYLVGTANGTLTQEINLGGMTTGLVWSHPTAGDAAISTIDQSTASAGYILTWQGATAAPQWSANAGGSGNLTAKYWISSATGSAGLSGPPVNLGTSISATSGLIWADYSTPGGVPTATPRLATAATTLAANDYQGGSPFLTSIAGLGSASAAGKLLAGLGANSAQFIAAPTTGGQVLTATGAGAMGWSALPGNTVYRGTASFTASGSDPSQIFSDSNVTTSSYIQVWPHFGTGAAVGAHVLPMVACLQTSGGFTVQVYGSVQAASPFNIAYAVYN